MNSRSMIFPLVLPAPQPWYYLRTEAVEVEDEDDRSDLLNGNANCVSDDVDADVFGALAGVCRFCGGFVERGVDVLIEGALDIDGAEFIFSA